MKLGMIGLGFMGLTHLKALRNIPDVELAVVCSNVPKALEGDLTDVGGNLGVEGEKFDFSRARKYSDWADAVRDPDIDAVDLCLPTHLHAPAAIAALESGKHVLVEKPFALNGEEADRIIEAAEKAGKIVMAAQVLRFFPDYVALIDIHRKGELGPMRAALFRRRCAAPTWGDWLPDPSKSGGGIVDLLIHDIDMAIHLFGLPEAVSAVGHEDLKRGIDIITGQLHYAGGGAVTITGGWHHPKSYPFSMEYTVSFDGGTAEYSSAGRPPKLYREDGSEQELPKPDKDGYQAEIEYFLECARAGRKPERCPPEESAAAVKLARLFAEARKKKGEKLECRI